MALGSIAHHPAADAAAGAVSPEPRSGLPRSMTELANRHGTDKGTLGPSGAWGALNYTDVYEGYFAPYRFEPISILEIGLGVTGERWSARIVHGRNLEGGASLKLWYDYFPNAKIYGIDVNPARHIDNDRIRTFVADQGDPGDLDAFLQAAGRPEFDIVIDDGSHRPDHQQVSLAFFLPRLKPHGVYVIEDLAANGVGDGATGRSASDRVLNTRSVLSAFKEQGRFAEPNALGDPEALAREIGSIAFHAPKISYPTLALGVAARLLGRRRSLIAYRPGTERLCVIRKR